MVKIFAAYDKKKRLIYAKDSINDEIYFCIECGKVVEIIDSVKKKRFFRHKVMNKNNCNQSLKHKLAKKEISSDFKKIGFQTQLEYTVGNQRIDIFAKYMKDSYAIEFQNSEIKKEDLNKRVTEYNQKGIKNLWILSDRYLSKKLNNRQIKFVNYSKYWKYYLLFYLPRQHRYILYYDIKQFGIGMDFQYGCKSFNQIEILTSFHPEQRLYIKSEQKNHWNINTQRKCYERGIDINKTADLLAAQKITFPPFFTENLLVMLGEKLNVYIDYPPMIKINTALVSAETKQCLRKIRYYKKLFLVKL